MVRRPRRPILPAVLACTALVLGWGVALAPPAQADPVPTVTATASTVWAHPGDTVTITVTFTNPETVPVTFGYLSLNPTYQNWSQGRIYRFTGCSGQMVSCWYSEPDPPMGVRMHPAYPTGVPIGPGESRTQTVTLLVEPTAPCDAGMGFFFYSYRESTAGNVSEMPMAPHIGVVC
jgi:hypothetical protein